ncbi:MAG: NADAR domain-containing protein [Candidatus Spyradocola sp.]
MINTLEDYICRSMPLGQDFATHPNLRMKVDAEGRLLPFLGNTVIFLLNDDTKQKLRELQASLYQAAPEMLAQPLQASTFHMTLHDLANGTPDQPGLRDSMRDTQQRASRLLSYWKDNPPLRMKTTWLFNMVNTSIVLGLAPADEDSLRRLDDMYTALEGVVRLGYALTPHITLAYFRPGVYGQETVSRLQSALRPVALEIELRPEQLVLQNFTDMNHYETARQDCIDRFRGEYEFLSNFYPARLAFDGIVYENAESAYQAQKLADPAARAQFARRYADEAKRMGQKVNVREDWDQVKLELMRSIVEAKFTQHPQLAKCLAETGSLPLLEGNHWGDTYWGVDLRTRQGENHLGRLLMALRERFQREGIPEARDSQLDRRFGPVDGVAVTDADITELDVQCIVAAADPAPPDGCAAGEARLTRGDPLNAEFVIRTVCPVYTRDDESLLAACYRNCLELAMLHGIRSIAFPILATGKCCFPKAKAVRTAVHTIREWLRSHADAKPDVVISCADHRLYDLTCEELGGENDHENLSEQ